VGKEREVKRKLADRLNSGPARLTPPKFEKAPIKDIDQRKTKLDLSKALEKKRMQALHT
jgi:hypothetical protein